MKFEYFNGVICLCLTLALSVLPAQAKDTYKTEKYGLAADRQIHKEDTRSLSHYIIAGYYQGQGDLERAVREYKKAIAIDPQSSWLHLNLASAFIQKDKMEEAVVELKKSIELDPEAVQPHALLALVYANQEKTDLATAEYILALENHVKFEPQNLDTYRGLGAIYLQQNKLKQAEGIFKLILNLSPLDAEAHFFLGNIYYNLKDYPSAEKELKSAIKLRADYHEALNFLGYFYLEQDKNIDPAGAMIKKALEIEPENGAYLDSLGWFYYKKGRFPEALNYLEKAASFLSDPVIYDHLGDVFLKLGDLEQAEINWQKSLKLNSQQEAVKAKLSEFIQHGQ